MGLTLAECTGSASATAEPDASRSSRDRGRGGTRQDILDKWRVRVILTTKAVPRRKKMQTTSPAANTPLYCSFCRKDRHHVQKLVGGPGVYICDACVGLCNRVLTGKPTAAFAGWDSLTDDEFLATLPAAAAAVDAVEQEL